MRRTLLIALILISYGSAVRAETWPQFRGATGDGSSTETNLPKAWSAEEGLAWQLELPGRANSSPVVNSRYVVVTTQTDDAKLWVLIIDRMTGQIERQVDVGQGELAATGAANLYAHRHNAATPTPAVDETHVWAFFGNGLLVCLEMPSGEVVWQRDMNRDFGPYDIRFGMATSPRLVGDLVIMACMTKGPSYVVAFDKKTGKQRWKQNRQLTAREDGLDAYSTPTVIGYGPQHRPAVLVAGADHVNAYDAASGQPLWISGGLAIDSPFGRIISSAIESEGIVVATSGNPPGGGLGHIVALPASSTGTVPDSARLWRHSQATPDSATPVALNGQLYLLSHNGIVSALDLKTGKVHWQRRIAEGPYHASLVVGDGKLYCLSISGTCTVLAASTDEQVLAKNVLEGDFYATPAISDGLIYLRSYQRLYAINGRPVDSATGRRR